MPNYETVDLSKQESPMSGLVGFIILIVVGGFSFLVSGPVQRFLMTANVSLGPAKLLPIQFPAGWSPLVNQAAVAFGLFLIIFVLAMIVLFLFMKPRTYDERNVSLDDMRKEVEARKRRR
jgi:hypothetical protein